MGEDAIVLESDRNAHQVAADQGDGKAATIRAGMAFAENLKAEGKRKAGVSIQCRKQVVDWRTGTDVRRKQRKWNREAIRVASVGPAEGARVRRHRGSLRCDGSRHAYKTIVQPSLRIRSGVKYAGIHNLGRRRGRQLRTDTEDGMLGT